MFKIGSLIAKAVNIRFLRHAVENLLWFCLPSTVYLKLRRWLSNKINLAHMMSSQSIFTKSKGTPILGIVPAHNQKRVVDVLICCAFKGRHEILEKSIKESLYSHHENKVEWFLCGSSNEDLEFIQKMAVQTGKVTGIIWKNNPLGEKWHFCVKAAGDLFDAELYAITGSDDILSSTLIHNIIAKHKQNISKGNATAMYCTNHWFIVRSFGEMYFPAAVTCELLHTDYYVPIGAGRFYSKQFMQSVHFKIFDERREKCLDDYGYLKVKELGCDIQTYDLNQGSLISIKGNWQQMNTLDSIVNADNIKINDFTFAAEEHFKQELSPELYRDLFGNKVTAETYSWA